jgi:hypothetical protein
MKAPEADTRPPDVHLAGFQLWVHGWEGDGVPVESYSDWLRVTAHCGGNGASVFVRGSIILASSIAAWVNDCERLYAELDGEAVLPDIEPYLRVRLTAHGPTGRITARIEITPEPLIQQHVFTFEIDQSYLPALIAQCRSVLKTYPPP